MASFALARILLLMGAMLLLLLKPSVAQESSNTATDTLSYWLPAATLPAYMTITCNLDDSDPARVPNNDSLISTTARMMDWCGCDNKLNPSGLAYAGMAVVDDRIAQPGWGPTNEPARTWVCSAMANASCDSLTDWYHALGNVSAQCGNTTGYFYDALRQMAWGFDTYWNTRFCETVAWAGIM